MTVAVASAALANRPAERVQMRHRAPRASLATICGLTLLASPCARLVIGEMPVTSSANRALGLARNVGVLATALPV